MSFFPFLLFLVLIIVTTFLFGSISDGALWLPAFAALLIPFFFARDKTAYADAMVDGMASREAILPVVCWLFAGVFSRILRDSGLAAGVAGLAAGAGVGSVTFTVITFIASAVFATASGTGFGTIAAGMALGLDRKFAVRFSFLMSLPAVLGANILSLKDALEAGVDLEMLPIYLVGMVVSGVVGYFAIRLVNLLADKGKFGNFAYYCWVVGLGSLIASFVVK